MKAYAVLGIFLFVSKVLAVHEASAVDKFTANQLFDNAVGSRTLSLLYLADRPYINAVYQDWLYFLGGDITISGEERWGDPQTKAFQPISNLENPVPPINTMDKPVGGSIIGWSGSDAGKVRKVDYDILQLDRLHVTGPAKITIPSRPLLIQVNKIVFETGATVTFSGGPVFVQAQKLSAPKNSTLQSLVSNEVRISVTADATTRKNVEESTGALVVEELAENLADPNYYRKDPNRYAREMYFVLLGGTDYFESIKQISDAGVFQLYRNIITELQQAQLKRQRARAIKWAKISASLPVPRQNFFYQDELASVQAAILEERKKLDQTLLRRIVSIKTREGISRSVAVYAKGDSLDNDIEPDTATLEIQNTQSRAVGILTKDPESVDQLRLYLRLRLSADPWSDDLVRRELSKDGEVLRGLFTRCELKATGFPPGVLKANVNLDNDLLDMDLTLNRALAGTFLAQLTLPLGVPFTFSWTSTEDPTISGNGLTFRISLQRNVNAGEFKLADGVVHNISGRTIRIAYAKAEGKFLAFDPPLVVKPSESKKLPIDQKTTRSLEIPRAAVTWPDIDPSAAALMFDIPDQNEVLQSIVIENHLSVYDQIKNRHLQKVLLEVEYEVRANTGNVIKVPGEKVSLAPAGGQGNSATLRFIKPQSGSVTVIVSGRAIYDIEEVPLKLKRFDTTAVNIGNDMLP